MPLVQSIEEGADAGVDFGNCLAAGRAEVDRPREQGFRFSRIELARLVEGEALPGAEISFAESCVGSGIEVRPLSQGKSRRFNRSAEIAAINHVELLVLQSSS